MNKLACFLSVSLCNAQIPSSKKKKKEYNMQQSSPCSRPPAQAVKVKDQNPMTVRVRKKGHGATTS